jgi:hypothetical protein
MEQVKIIKPKQCGSIGRLVDTQMNGGNDIRDAGIKSATTNEGGRIYQQGIV